LAESYLKDAFFMPPNLIGLGIGAVASLALFPPLLLGVAALEGMYLWTISSNPRFQRMVRSRKGR
jgi:hypothetical protein